MACPPTPGSECTPEQAGTIRRVAPASMVLAGSLAQWRQWTGLPFDRTSAVIVPEALVPVHCDAEHDRAAYVEPNVWVEHVLRGDIDAADERT
jgi:hypothetical protein